MRFASTFKSATKSLFAHKMRSIFTIIGIVIGIATVTIVLSIGEGLKTFIVDQVQSFGSDSVFVEARNPDSIQFTVIDTLKAEEAYEIRDSDRFPYVKDVYAYIGTQSIASSRYKQISVDIFGTNEGFINIDSSKIGTGRFFNQAEEKSLKRVAVLGYKTATKLFPAGDPIGQSFKLDKVSFKIIGVLAERGFNISIDIDNMVFIPLDVAQKLLAGTDYILFFAVQVTDPEFLQLTKTQIENFLRKKHGIKDKSKDDFAASTADEAVAMMDDILLGIKYLLLAIGFISLIVGGIGIMNIMYVTVTERIREIGIRKTVGATSRDILHQFLLEAIIMTIIGGILGIIVGITVIYMIISIANFYGFSWPYTLSLEGIIWALTTAFIFGLVFGLAPARKAAKQNPIEALHYE